MDHRHRTSSPLLMSPAAAIDPVEAFVAYLSSCDILWFLFIAAKRKFDVDPNFDAAVGIMGKNWEGKLTMLHATLGPEVIFSGELVPAAAQIDYMQQDALKECFIANSVKTEVRCEPVYVDFW